MVASRETGPPAAHRRIGKLADVLHEPNHYTGVIAAVSASSRAPLSAPACVAGVLRPELRPGQDEAWSWLSQVHTVHRRSARDPAPKLACSEHITVSMANARQIRANGSVPVICDPFGYRVIHRAMTKLFGVQGRPAMVTCLYRALPRLTGDTGGHTHEFELQGTMVGGVRKGGKLAVALPLCFLPGHLGVSTITRVGEGAGDNTLPVMEFEEGPRGGTGQQPSLRLRGNLVGARGRPRPRGRGGRRNARMAEPGD